MAKGGGFEARNCQRRGLKGVEALWICAGMLFCWGFGKNYQKLWANGGGGGSDPHIPPLATPLAEGGLIAQKPITYFSITHLKSSHKFSQGRCKTVLHPQPNCSECSPCHDNTTPWNFFTLLAGNFFHEKWPFCCPQWPPLWSVLHPSLVIFWSKMPDDTAVLS